MPFLVLIIALLIVVTAYNDTWHNFATQLEGDIPGYFKFAAAIVVILALGYIPGMKIPSRWLLGLVVVILFLTQYQAIVAGIQNFASSGGTATAQGGGGTEPTAAYVASGGTSGTPTQAAIIGSSSGSSGANPVASAAGSASTVLTAAQTLAANPLSPNSYVGLFQGFGGLA